MLFEIVRRDGCPIQSIIPETIQQGGSFRQVKAFLTKRRYPNMPAVQRKGLQRFLKIPEPCRIPEAEADVRHLEPKRILVEETLMADPFVQRLRQMSPDARVEPILSYKHYCRQQAFSLTDYNRRGETFFVVREPYRYWQPCPCSKGSVSCGYAVLNLGQGCPFNCTYCFMQGYLNSPGIVLPANINDFFQSLEAHGGPWRIGTGQFSDSLALDHFTQYSRHIIPFMRRHPDWFFEFKTKSDNINWFMREDPLSNIYVGWSLNPERIIARDEQGTASLAARLAAAERCVARGWRVTFHFDPIVYDEGWEESYQDVIRRLFRHVSPARIAWMSLGCLRMMPRLKQVMESRFPATRLLSGELVPGFDGKLRYPLDVRRRIYKSMLSFIREQDERVPVYLCMEQPEAWEGLSLERHLDRAAFFQKL
ncbi:MAG: spore photoproduct lyase family protein [Candidatus Omnitrophota bacterium]